MFQWTNTLAIILLASCATVVHAEPIIWVDDSSGTIGKVDVTTGAVTIVGPSGVILTDIAFDPNGNLYGIDFSNLYRINTTTGAAKLIAPLTGALSGQANALVFGADGTLFSAGFDSTHLFSINPISGATTDLGNVGSTSAGDLAFVNGHLDLAGPFGGTTHLIQIDLNPDNTVSSFKDVGSTGFTDVFGLASPDNMNLFGVAGTQVLSINPATGAGSLVSNYGGHGLSSANGAAFFAEATPVPEPGSLTLFAFGTLSLVVLRRRWTLA